MSREQYLPVVVDAAKKFGLDPVYLAAQIQQESGWKPNAVSSAGARGIAQFMPATAKAYGVDVNDPVSSIYGAARYMSYLKNMFNGDESLARMAYNAGEGNLKKFLEGKRKLAPETLNYNAAIDRQAQKIAKETGIGMANPSSLPRAVAQDGRNNFQFFESPEPQTQAGDSMMIAEMPKPKDSFFDDIAKMTAQPTMPQEQYVPMQIRYALSNMWDDAEVDNG